MKDEDKSKQQLVSDLAKLRHRVVELEVSENERKRAEEALRESEERYRILVENSIAGIYIRRDNKLLFASETFCKRLDYSWDELKEIRFIDLVHPDDRSIAKDRAEKRMAGEHPAESYQCRTMKKNGEILWVEVFGSQIDYEGQPAVLGNFVDITERKKAARALQEAYEDLEQRVKQRTSDLAKLNEDLRREISEREQTEEALRESEKKYRLLLENTGLSVVYHDLDGTFLMMNSIGAENLGGVPEDFVGKTLHELFGADAADMMVDRARRIVESGEGAEYEDKIRLPSGSRWFWSLLRPVKDGRGRMTGIQVTSRDITKRRQMEEALREAKEHLEIKVEERTEELRRKNDELEMFAFFISHDLQAPLRNIEHFSQKLSEDLGERLEERHREGLKGLIHAAENMNKLIDDMMTYAHLGIQDFSKTELSLKGIIMDAQFPLMEDIKKSGAVVYMPDPLPAVTGHERTLVRLMINLLSNAIKFMPPERKPEIHVEAIRTENGVRVSVSDNGVGIDPEYIEKIFRMFERLHSKHDYPGTGVGLAIVKKAAELHGGTVGVESEEGKGSTFWFEIPD